MKLEVLTLSSRAFCSYTEVGEMVPVAFKNIIFFLVEMLVSVLSKHCFAGRAAFLSPTLHFSL